MSVGAKVGKSGSGDGPTHDAAADVKVTPSSLVASRSEATRQIHRSLKAWRDQDEAVESSSADDRATNHEQADDSSGDKEQVHRSVSANGDRVFLADDPTKLTGGGRRKLGNLTAMAGMTVRAAIKERGGGAGQANMCGQWADKTVAETANAAAAGDELAETAIKMIKQASAKAGDHGGRSG